MVGKVGNPTEEERAVAAALVQSRWGDTGVVTDHDLWEAAALIAAANALIAFRMASGPKGLPTCYATIGTANGAGGSAIEREGEGA